MNLNEIDRICSKMKIVNAKVSDRMQQTPGTMNIIEIMNRHHLEIQHSNILVFLITPTEKHHHREYGASFVKLLKEKGLKLTGDSITFVKREATIEENRRIDILMNSNCNSEYLVIEIKIKGKDQKNQLHDYITSIERKNSTKAYVVYLTLYGDDPSEYSISKNELELLKNENRYISLSYSKDIIKWLNGLLPKEGETVLQAAIEQYKDIINALTNQREEVFNMNQEIAKEIVETYGNLTRQELKDKLISVHEFLSNIHLLIYIRFFTDVYGMAPDKLKLFCDDKKDYKNINDWRKDVIKSQKQFGVSYSKNGITKDLFVPNRANSKSVIFACNVGIENIKSCGNPIDNLEENNLGKYTSAVEPTEWFTNALFAKDDWEQKNNDELANHVVKHWFEID